MSIGAKFATIAAVAVFALASPSLFQSTPSIAPTTDASTSVATARLEERVAALYRLLDERAKQVELALASAEKATDKALEAQQRVNATQNEFRGALDDQNKLLASKESLDLLVDRVRSLETSVASGVGRTGGTSSVQNILFNVIPIVIAAIALAAALRGRRAGNAAPK